MYSIWAADGHTLSIVYCLCHKNIFFSCHYRHIHLKSNHYSKKLEAVGDTLSIVSVYVTKIFSCHAATDIYILRVTTTVKN
jgi:hypothetical protein